MNIGKKTTLLEDMLDVVATQRLHLELIEALRLQLAEFKKVEVQQIIGGLRTQLEKVHHEKEELQEQLFMMGLEIEYLQEHKQQQSRNEGD